MSTTAELPKADTTIEVMIRVDRNRSDRAYEREFLLQASRGSTCALTLAETVALIADMVAATNEEIIARLRCEWDIATKKLAEVGAAVEQKPAA